MERLNSVLQRITDGGRLLTIQPGGNHGDTLIYQGFNTYLESTEIKQLPFRERAVRADHPPGIPSTDPTQYIDWLHHQLRHIRHRIGSDIDAVYIHGGGNFNDLWSEGIKCYRTIGRYFDCPIVVGPQSCQFNQTDPSQVFGSVTNETYFFCREKYSYEIIEEASQSHNHVNVYLDDDTALFLTIGDIPTQYISEEYTLLAMRADAESTKPLIKRNISSPIYVEDISTTASSFAEFVNIAAKAKHIHTDRLHGTILGDILGKSITWYDNSYHKSRGVYEYSLSEKPNIEFVSK